MRRRQVLTALTATQRVAAANDKQQSGKTFMEMVAILDEHPELDARVNVVKFSKRIEVLHGQGKGSIFQALSADASTKQGLSPNFTIPVGNVGVDWTCSNPVI